MNIQFQHPQAFWLLTLIPLMLILFLFYQSWKRSTGKKIGDIHLVKELSKNHSATKTVLKFIFIAIAFACGCIALANPRVPDKNSAEVRKGIDVVIALDVSNSMKATDIAPIGCQGPSNLFQNSLTICRMIELVWLFLPDMVMLKCH